MMCASRFDFSTIDWGMLIVMIIAPARDLFLGYRSFFLADLYHVSNLVLQIALHAEKDVSLIVDGDTLHVLQLAAESGDGSELFSRGVKVKLVVVTVGYVQRSAREIDRLRRKGIVAIDDAMQFAVRIEQIKDVVLIVGNVQIAAVVKDHAFRLGDSVLLAEKIGNLSIARDAENFVLFAV